MTVGAAEGFDEFFVAERSRLVAQAYLLAADIHSAQDLAQCALERAWRNWETVGAYDRPDRWARRVLLNLALNERRRWTREVASADLDRQATNGPSELHVALVQALRQLPPEQQKAVVLHHGAGLPVAEVAADLGVPEGTVKSWLSRGRAKLAQSLSGESCRTEAR